MSSETIASALEFIAEQLRAAQPELAASRDELRSEARAILRVAAAADDAEIYGNPGKIIDADSWEKLRDVVQRRCDGEPLAYIEGQRGFRQIELQVDSNVLVPRPETELLVDALLQIAPATEFTVLDAGTGSGAIALAIADARRDARVTGCDISPAALEVAQRNAAMLGLDVEWLESDWFAAFGERCFDFICCNPPYVRSGDPHLEALRHEPLLALDGGPDGLDAIRNLLSQAAAHLTSAGRLLLEHGYDQADEIASIALAVDLRVTEELPDLAGHQRVSIIGRTERS